MADRLNSNIIIDTDDEDEEKQWINIEDEDKDSINGIMFDLISKDDEKHLPNKKALPSSSSSSSFISCISKSKPTVSSIISSIISLSPSHQSSIQNKPCTSQQLIVDSSNSNHNLTPPNSPISNPSPSISSTTLDSEPLVINSFEQLTKEQKDAYHLVVEQGKSVFIYGDAGTGKSFLTKAIIEGLEEKRLDVSKTGSTGIAALNINGITLHGWCGLGLMNEKFERLLKKAKKIPTWKNTDVLIIDEISMVSGELLGTIDAIAKIVRKRNDEPFGGIQMIFIGDFFQLPPVEQSKKQTIYAFETKAWTDCVEHTIELTQQMRQTDQEFISMLKEVRIGNMSKKTIDAFNSHVIKDISQVQQINGIEPTILHTHRHDVEAENYKRLMELPDELVEYDAVSFSDKSIKGAKELEFLKKNCMAPQKLQLKIGAQVMLLKNIDIKLGLANGSRGVVTKLNENHIVVDFKHIRSIMIKQHTWTRETKKGHVCATIKQFPLMLAYAITIHKSQGLTLDYMIASIHKSFSVGQAYVALSRARDINGLYLFNFNPQKITTCTRVKTFYEKLQKNSNLAVNKKRPLISKSNLKPKRQRSQ